MKIFKKSYTEKGLVKNDSNIQISRKSNLYKSQLWDRIPPNIKELLYISNVAPIEINQGFAINISIDLETGKIDADDVLPDDPSTLYVNLPLIESNKDIEKPQYWPAYATITAEQRWIYLDWLSNISTTIDPGYVFILYYGLERQLLLGNFEKAFRTIIELRKYHENRSFKSYSLAGLLYSCVLRNKPAFMYELKEQLSSSKWENEELLVKYWLDEDISSEEFSFLVMGFKDLNKRYVKDENELYTKAIGEVFLKKFKKHSLPLTDLVDFQSVKKKKSIAFANFSFPENVRFIETPTIIEDRSLKSIVTEIHKTSHEIVKNELKVQRKKGAT